VASGAGVVVVQAQDLVEEEKPAEVGAFRIDRTAEPRLQRGLGAAGEPGPGQRRGEAAIEVMSAGGRGTGGGRLRRRAPREPDRRAGGDHEKQSQERRSTIPVREAGQD